MQEKALLSLAEVQDQELVILEKLIAFLERHNLRYSMIYGSLIGVVRHQGFIPWDDDVDIAMPRPDYLALIDLTECLREETGYALSGIKGHPLDIAPILKVCDESIAVLERGVKGEGSLWVDVFPVDGLPEEEAEAVRHCKKIWRRRMLLVAQTSPVSSARTLSRKIVKLLAKASRLFTKPRKLSSQITYFAQRYPYQESRIVNAITWSDYGFEGRFSRKAMDRPGEGKFEGLDVRIITEYDRNLGGIYGDYMCVPPKDKQITHSLVAWRRRGEPAE